MVQQTTSETSNVRDAERSDAKQSERSTQGIRKFMDHFMKHEMHNTLAHRVERMSQSPASNLQLDQSDPLAQTEPMAGLSNSVQSAQQNDGTLEVPQVAAPTAASAMSPSDSAAAPVADSAQPTAADSSSNNLQTALSSLSSDMSNFMSDIGKVGQDFEQIGRILQSMSGNGTGTSGDAPAPAPTGGTGDQPAAPASGGGCHGGSGDGSSAPGGSGGGVEAPPASSGNGGDGSSAPSGNGGDGGTHPPADGPQPTPTNDTAIPPVPADALNVQSFGAKGDGSSDDTAAIQAALDQASKSGGGAVYIPAGTYMISSSENGKGGLQLPSNVQLFMTPQTTLESEANDSPSGQIININNATNSAIYGGIINGNEAGASANDPEYNHGIRIGGSSSDITIQGVTSENNTGDGYYVAVDGQSNITLNGDISDHNGRNDMSVTRFQGNMIIENSTFENAASTGIDVEPNPGDTTSGIHILNNTIENNPYGGLSFGAEGGVGNATNADNVVDGNTFTNDGTGKHHDIFLELGPQTITNNNIESADAIIDESSGVTNDISGNTVTGN